MGLVFVVFPLHPPVPFLTDGGGPEIHARLGVASTILLLIALWCPPRLIEIFPCELVVWCESKEGAFEVGVQREFTDWFHALVLLC